LNCPRPSFRTCTRSLSAAAIACRSLSRPQVFILNGNGVLNAFATRFWDANTSYSNTDVIDAMSRHTDGVRFYMGHELGHLRMKHLSGHLLRCRCYGAHFRARLLACQESTCDRHGLACSSSPEGAPERWQRSQPALNVGKPSTSLRTWANRISRRVLDVIP